MPFKHPHHASMDLRKCTQRERNTGSSLCEWISMTTTILRLLILEFQNRGLLMSLWKHRGLRDSYLALQGVPEQSSRDTDLVPIRMYQCLAQGHAQICVCLREMNESSPPKSIMQRPEDGPRGSQIPRHTGAREVGGVQVPSHLSLPLPTP